MAGKDSSESKYEVTTKEISEILGVSTRRIQQLAKENALVRVSHGKFDLPSSINAYLEFQMERERSDEEIDKYVEEAMWTRAKREKTELELKIMKGEVHRGDDVRRVISDMLASFRGRLLSFPSKYAPQVIGLTEIPPIKEKLKQGIFEALEELAEYDPHVFYDESRDKLYIEDEEDQEEEVDEGEELKNDGQTEE
ncbi:MULTISPECIES: hypothetical protein [Pontibacillus]|uniref:Uncharacterized protein n=1 Tax=Pontibacillus chungwhensis TaxID=265426 RepID=A0ABY8V2B4_9BACI|nr:MULTISPECIES: hypothetical protein [Pontibacillus]MCD5324764.1 hypothetical protein [Pontibacillus sp. HN14]WIF98724.1 hypothetical protein QNI29_03470 [Pontibacillus chungwhensis]